MKNRHAVTKYEGPNRKVQINDPKYTPYTKKAGSVDAMCLAEFKMNENASWLNVHLEEIVKHDKTTRSKVISFTLTEAEASMLYNLLAMRFDDRLKGV